MNFFKKTFEKLQEKISTLFSLKTNRNTVNTEGKKPTKDGLGEQFEKIEQEQKDERCKIVQREFSTTISDTPIRIKKLSPIQKNLVKEKLEIKKESIEDTTRLLKLLEQKELLSTNLEVQKRLKNNFEEISEEHLIALKKTLQAEKDSDQDIIKQIQQNRLNAKEHRATQKKKTDSLRKEMFQFSLIEVLKERERVLEEIRREEKRQEKLRVQKIKFDKSIKKANNLIDKLQFIDAERELDIALKINKKKHSVVKKLKDKIEGKRRHYEGLKNQLANKLKEVEDALKKDDFDLAHHLLSEALLYGVDVTKVNEKILYVKQKIVARDKREGNYQLKVNKIISAIEEKKFIKAKRAINNILEEFEDKADEINELQKELDESKIKQNKIKADFKEKVINAEKKYEAGKYLASKRIFNEALKLNIDNEKCEKRIREIDFKLRLELKIKRQEKLKKEEEEKRLLEQKKYKKEKDEILSFLRKKRIEKFYHFTDSSNISSIKLNGGLFSWKYCDNNGIEITRPGGDATSRRLDCRHNLEDYVRLSFVKNHPMKYIAQRENRIHDTKILEIDIETATLKKTKYSDMNATRNDHSVGKDYNFLKNKIRYDIIGLSNHFDLENEDKPFYQAEIMVKEQVELKYIKNL